MNTSVGHQLIKRGLFFFFFKSPENLKLYCKMRSQILVNIINWLLAAQPEGGIIQDLKQKVFLPTTLWRITSLSKWREKNGQKTRQKVPLRWVISSSYHIPSCLGENVAGSDKRKLEEAKGEKKKILSCFLWNIPSHAVSPAANKVTLT